MLRITWKVPGIPDLLKSFPGRQDGIQGAAGQGHGLFQLIPEQKNLHPEKALAAVRDVCEMQMPSRPPKPRRPWFLVHASAEVAELRVAPPIHPGLEVLLALVAVQLLSPV